MIVYDPFISPEVSPGSVEKIIAKNLNIKYANIDCGRQERHERKFVENSIQKAVEIMAGKKQLKLVKKYDSKK